MLLRLRLPTTSKSQLFLASEVIETFTDFLQSCGFHRNTILDSYKRMSDELSEL